MIKLVAILLILTTIYSGAGSAQNKSREVENKLANWIEWMPDESLGFPIEIAIKTWMKNQPASNDLYIFLQASFFTKENVEKIVTQVPQRYPIYLSIQVTIYSSKEKLLNSMQDNMPGICYFQLSGQEAREKAEAYRISMNRGFFRAFYYCGCQNERYFEYSPDPEKEELVKVILPSPGNYK